ncbi:unnamed protein product [Didymodactylos carnosus]|uniref:EGF-like domain-containing protein n=1 Tax=Didymodactylos carnosus TaxID=1234261 RepID=A0A8S2RXD4_9BILA|nr:unnamed protein product [Didymodactylos carnosus]CAF4381317.1 unnamed protein product [Didymodactylos carnosus]
MKLIILIQLIGGICYVLGGSSDVENRENATEAYNRVGEYLTRELQKYNSSMKLTRKAKSDQIPNSNIIGAGYNPVIHNPICFTRDCQMASFGLPIFEFDYVRPEYGAACAKGLLKPHRAVTFRCKPGFDDDTHVDIIDKLDSLKKTTLVGLEISAGANIPVPQVKSVAATYKSSIQTQFMVNNILEKHVEVVATTRKVSYAELSMYQELMNLSPEFIFAINNMPCCDSSDEMVYKYIVDRIFKYFGFTYVEHLILGGIASENIFIHRSNVTKLTEDKVNIAREAKISFGEIFNVGTNATFSHEVEEKKKFDQSVEDRYRKVIGGNAGQKSWDDWSKSVDHNPVVIKFSVTDIFRLLNTESNRFPKSDSRIDQKRQLIQKALDKYLNISFYCPRNCGGHGKCVDTGYFQVGECKCDNGWTGADCSSMTGLSGTLCGINNKIECNGGPVIKGNYPQHGCAPGYVKQDYHWSVTCRKQVNTNSLGFAGTLCGIYVKGFSIKCGGKKPWLEKCPNGYKLSDMDGGSAYYCYKTDATSEDLPGTLCGYGRTYHNVQEEFDCDGHYPSRNDCPPNYHLDHADVGQPSYTYTYRYCVKN